MSLLGTGTLYPAAIVHGLAGPTAGAELQGALGEALSGVPALLAVGQEGETGADAPHAHLNYILLDDSLKVLDMGYRSVGETEPFKGGSCVGTS